MDISFSVDMRHIRAFLAVARHGSFTRAAADLALSQPALTICVRQLEDSLGLAVFNRTTRRVTLTPAGREFLPAAQQLAGDFESALSMLKAHADVQRGRVAVAAIPSVASEWLPPMVSQFARAFPKIAIEIVSDNSPGIIRRLREGEVNFGFVGLLNASNDTVARELYAEPIQLVCRRDHPLAMREGPLCWRDLDGHEFLDSGNDDCTRTVLAELPFLSETLTGAQYRTNKAAILVAMVDEGIGVTAMPAFAVPREYRAKLAFRPLAEPLVQRKIYLVTRRDHTMSPAEDRFVADALVMIEQLRRIDNGVAASANPRSRLQPVRLRT